MKLNVGCGGYALRGYHNVDVDVSSSADEVIDFWGAIERYCDLDEVRMDHFLEHLMFVDCGDALRLCRAALREGGLVRVEVPDLEEIMAGRTGPVTLQQALYGAQPDETHLNGFTAYTIERDLTDAGFRQVSVSRFNSAHPERRGFPCLLATGVR